MVSKHPTDENRFGGSWSIRKLECVEGYLNSYLKVMSRQNWANLWYVDAFSGDGYQRLGDEGLSDETLSLFDGEQDCASKLLEGSAMRAIRLSAQREESGLRSFDHFSFLEYDESKISSLRATIAEEYPSQLRKCQFIMGDANVTLPTLLSERNWREDRAVTFIDPCATQLKWNTIEAFKTTCSDVWLLFPLSAVLRMLPKNSLPSEGVSKALDGLFGDSTWRTIYKTREYEQLNLFGDSGDVLHRTSGFHEVIAYATERYREVFPEVNGPAILKTERNTPLFALYSMVSNESERAREISRGISMDLIKKIGD